MKIRLKKQNQGFTLIEILIALTLASSVMGMVIYTITSSLDLRKKTIRLNTAVFLAENLMDEIKNKEDLVDNSGSIKENTGYSYSYSMKEIDYDPLSGLTGSDSNNTNNTLQEHRAGTSTELSTGLTFKMRQYNVSIFYNEKLIYDLECLRGLKIEQVK